MKQSARGSRTDADARKLYGRQLPGVFIGRGTGRGVEGPC